MSIARQFQSASAKAAPQRIETTKPADQSKGKAGRPKSANPMVVLNIRVEPEVLEALRSGGKGWQERARAALRKAAGL